MSSALRRRLGDPSPRMVDVAITVAVGVPVVGSTLASGIEQDRVLAGLAFGLAATLPLLVRRRWPFAVLAISLAAAIATTVDGQYVFPIMVALYTIGSTRSWEAALAAAAVPPAAGLIYMRAGGTEFTYDDLIAVGLTCAVSAGIGLFVRGRRERVEVFRERAERLERELLARGVDPQDALPAELLYVQVSGLVEGETGARRTQELAVVFLVAELRRPSDRHDVERLVRERDSGAQTREKGEGTGDGATQLDCHSAGAF